MAGVERERKREERGKRRGTGERGKLAPATRNTAAKRNAHEHKI